MIQFMLAGPTSGVPKVVEEIQKREIELEDVLFIVQAMAVRDEQGDSVDWYSAIRILMERYRGDPIKVSCIIRRVECLIPLTNDSCMGGWSIESFDKQYAITNIAVYRAVAKCPLRAAAPTGMWFDADEFFNLALESRSAGSA